MEEAAYLPALTILTVNYSVQPENILLQKWKTPFGTSPFGEIKSNQFMLTMYIDVVWRKLHS